MKRFLLAVALAILATVGVVAQDTETAMTDEVQTIFWQTVDAGEFVETDDPDIFTVTLTDFDANLTYFLLAPQRGFGRLSSDNFNLVMEAIEDLEGLEAILELENQDLMLLLSDFVVDEENGTTVSFTAEVTEIIAKTDDKAASEVPLEFEDGELLFYFNADAVDAYATAFNEISSGLRNSDCGELCP